MASYLNTTDAARTGSRATVRRRIELIHDEIRDRICLLEYPPGTKLRESDLAGEFSVSRTPIRQVLQQLASAGLVEVRNGVGTMVTDLDPGTVREIYEFRLRIAAMIGEIQPRPITAEQRGHLEQLLPRARRLVDCFDIKEYFAANHATHFVISTIIGNVALRDAWDRLYFQVARFWYSVASSQPTQVAQSLVREIEDLADAARRDDPRAIGYIQCRYISFGMQMVTTEVDPAARAAASLRQ